MKASVFKTLYGASVRAMALLALLAPHAVRAQSFCASDRQPQPTQLLERFISADCASCWQDTGAAKAARGEIALDWVVPGNLGENAPLSAVATRDAAQRLDAAVDQALGANSIVKRSAVRGLPGATLRVAHGLPVTGYIGASIALTPGQDAAEDQPWTAWLALVETLPQGTEGSTVARNLVRNTFKATWNGRKQLSKTERPRFVEQRSMGLPDGVDPRRLRVIGWVEDARGQVRAAAASRCPPDNGRAP